MVEVDKRSFSVAGDVDLQSLCSDPVVLAGVLVGIDNKVVSLSSVEDDVVQVRYWLDEESVSCNERELVTVNGESAAHTHTHTHTHTERVRIREERTQLNRCELSYTRNLKVIELSKRKDFTF